VAAVDKAGYDARILDALGQSGDDDAASRKDAERLSIKRDLVIASALALPVFILEMGAHLIPSMHHWVMDTLGRESSWHLQFLLTTLVLPIPGRRFSGFR